MSYLAIQANYADSGDHQNSSSIGGETLVDGSEERLILRRTDQTGGLTSQERLSTGIEIPWFLSNFPEDERRLIHRIRELQLSAGSWTTGATIPRALNNLERDIIELNYNRGFDNNLSTFEHDLLELIHNHRQKKKSRGINPLTLVTDAQWKLIKAMNDLHKRQCVIQ